MFDRVSDKFFLWWKTRKDERKRRAVLGSIELADDNLRIFMARNVIKPVFRGMLQSINKGEWSTIQTPDPQDIVLRNGKFELSRKRVIDPYSYQNFVIELKVDGHAIDLEYDDKLLMRCILDTFIARKTQAPYQSLNEAFGKPV